MQKSQVIKLCYAGRDRLANGPIDGKVSRVRMMMNPKEEMNLHMQDKANWQNKNLKKDLWNNKNDIERGMVW